MTMREVKTYRVEFKREERKTIIVTSHEINTAHAAALGYAHGAPKAYTEQHTIGEWEECGFEEVKGTD